ncbi:MAG: ABC transporter permease [Sumerlaeia bacterium]
MIDFAKSISTGAAVFFRAFLPTLLKKLPIALGTLWFVATLVFLLTKLAGGEADMIGGEGRMDERTRQAIMQRYYLDQPLHIQYVKNMQKVAVFDSLPARTKQDRTLRELLSQHLPASIGLGWRAVLLAVLLGVPIGVMCAVKHNEAIDQGGIVLSLLGVSVPNFVLASLAVFFLARVLGWLPATGWHESWWRMWIPAACLGAFPFAAILRLTRASMLEALRQDYVRTARSKGVAEYKVVLRHALRNSLSSVVTYIGPVVAALLTGSLVVEKIFAVPGIGELLVHSINNRDMPLLLGLVVFFSATLIFMNLLVDSLYPVINPRLRDA